MYWTHTAPRSEGYHWVRYTAKSTGVIVYISHNASGDWQVHTAAKYGWPISKVLHDYPEAQWSEGPIAVPTEPSNNTSWDC